jgi:glycosyltransferase involved in cell wall biosynthesis
MSKLIILIPSYNEIKSLKKLLISLKNKYKILVVDDGSIDGTENFLKKNKINHIVNKKNQGYTFSLIRGINFIRKKKQIDYILTLDADGEHKLNYIKNIIDKIKTKKLDLVIGNRDSKNRISEILISNYVNIKYGVEDPFSGFKIYKSQHLYKYINKIHHKKFMIDLLAMYLKNSLKVGNIQIKTKKIKNRQSKIGSGIINDVKMFSLIKYFI